MEDSRQKLKSLFVSQITAAVWLRRSLPGPDFVLGVTRVLTNLTGVQTKWWWYAVSTATRDTCQTRGVTWRLFRQRRRIPAAGLWTSPDCSSPTGSRWDWQLRCYRPGIKVCISKRKLMTRILIVLGTHSKNKNYENSEHCPICGRGR